MAFKRKLVEESLPEVICKKHTLDTDEEDSDEFEKDDNADGYVDGEEDGVEKICDDVKITPFNMREELLEGQFDRDGQYHWHKTNEIRDNWLENIDWVKEHDVTYFELENNLSEDYCPQNDESDTFQIDENSSEPIPVNESTPTFRPRPPKRTSKSQSQLTTSVLQSVNEHFKQPKLQEDRFDVFGKTVAMKLRDLPKVTRVLTEKIINDALFEAEMGTLTASHKIMVPPKHNFRIITPSATCDSISASSYFQNFRGDNK